MGKIFALLGRHLVSVFSSSSCSLTSAHHHNQEMVVFGGFVDDVGTLSPQDVQGVGTGWEAVQHTLLGLSRVLVLLNKYRFIENSIFFINKIFSNTPLFGDLQEYWKQK